MKCDPIGEYDGLTIIRLTRQQMSELKKQCPYQSIGVTKKAPYFAPTHRTFNLRLKFACMLENRVFGENDGFTEAR